MCGGESMGGGFELCACRNMNNIYTHTQVDNMITNIKEVVSRTLNLSHCMDDQSREVAKEKVSFILSV